MERRSFLKNVLITVTLFPFFRKFKKPQPDLHFKAYPPMDIKNLQDVTRGDYWGWSIPVGQKYPYVAGIDPFTPRDAEVHVVKINLEGLYQPGDTIVAEYPANAKKFYTEDFLNWAGKKA